MSIPRRHARTQVRTHRSFSARSAPAVLVGGLIAVAGVGTAAALDGGHPGVGDGGRAQPTDIQLSANSIPENSAIGTPIGTFATTDPDAGDTFTYAKVNGSGSADNASFDIVGDELRAAERFNFEAKASYSIRVRSLDSGGEFRVEQFTITVTNANDRPTDIALSNTTVAENTPAGTTVGTLSTTDGTRGQGFTYLLVAGNGSTDNASFQIDGSALERPPLDFEADATRSVRIRTTDGGAPARSLVEVFTITVTDVNDAPVATNDTLGAGRSAVGNTTLVVNDPGDGAPVAGDPHKTVNGSILANDADVDGPGPLTVTAGTFASNDGGSVTIESDGDFAFRPAAGTSCTDTSDSFDYTVSDAGSPIGSDTGTVTILISDCVWYVSNSAAGNAGTSSAPFDTLAQAEIASGAQNTIFVFDGDNTTTGYGAGIDLKTGQRLIGESAGLAVGDVTLQTANPANRPTITDNNADVVVLDVRQHGPRVRDRPAGHGWRDLRRRR